MIGYWLIICHLVGDYVFQSDWMANEKTKRFFPAFTHAVVYTIPFAALFWITGKWEPRIGVGEGDWALWVIVWSHFFIDRFRLARYVCWLKNFLAPGTRRKIEYLDNGAKVCADGTMMSMGPPDAPRPETEPVWWHPWSECSGTGYHKDKPAWLAVWLLFIADNTLHLAINGLAWHLAQ